MPIDTKPSSSLVEYNNPPQTDSLPSNQNQLAGMAGIAAVSNFPVTLSRPLSTTSDLPKLMQRFMAAYNAAYSPSDPMQSASQSAAVVAERNINPVAPPQPKMGVSDVSSAARIHPDLYAAYQKAWDGFQARVLKRAPLFVPPAPTQLFTVVTQQAPIRSDATPMHLYDGIFDGYYWNDPINFVHGRDKVDNYPFKQCLLVLADATGSSLDALAKKAGVPLDTNVRMTGLEVEALSAMCGYYGHTLGMIRDTWWDSFGVKKYFSDAVREHPQMVAKLIFGRVKETLDGNPKAQSGKICAAVVGSRDGYMDYGLFDCLEATDKEGVGTVRPKLTDSLSNSPKDAIYWVLENDERGMSKQYWDEKDLDRKAAGLPPYKHSAEFRPLMLAAHSWGAKFSEAFDDDAPGASVFSRWLDDFRLYAGVWRCHKSKIRLDMVKLLNDMADIPELRREIYNIVSQAEAQAPASGPERYSPVLIAMDGAYRGAQEEIRGRQMRFAMSADNTNPHLDYAKQVYNQDTGYATVLGGLLLKTNAEIVAMISPKGIALPSAEMQTLKNVERLYAAANYRGKMIPFFSDREVKKYLIRAIEKAPKLILKLALGYVPREGGAKVVVVKAWWSLLNGGSVCHDSKGKQVLLYQQKNGADAYKDADGKMIYIQLKGGKLCHSSEDGKPQGVYEGELKPSIAYRLLDYDAQCKASPHAYSGFSQLPPCDEFWLYETGKRYPFSITSKQK